MDVSISVEEEITFHFLSDDSNIYSSFFFEAFVFGFSSRVAEVPVWHLNKFIAFEGDGEETYWVLTAFNLHSVYLSEELLDLLTEEVFEFSWD